MGCGCSSASLGGPPSAFHSTYILEERLGRGTYGQVWSCSHVETHDRFAVKILRLWRGPETLGKVSFMRQQLTSREAREKAKNEAALWARIGRHEHCVELHKVFMENMLCYLVMEPCVRSVVKALQETWPCPIEEDILRIVYHSLLALHHVHGRGIVHRDVKPENILLGGPDGTVAKLCDFGLAADLVNGGERLQEVAGTPPYMAPEMLHGHMQTPKIDLWSLGVTAYVMLYGSFPYPPAKPGSIQSVKQVIVWGVPPPRYRAVADLPTPSKLAELTAKTLLVRSPDTREDAAGVLQLAVGEELRQVATTPLEAARRSAGPRISFLPVVQAAQREIAIFQGPSRDGALDRVLEQRRRLSEARRNTFSGALEQAPETDGGGRWRRWSTGAMASGLAMRRDASPAQRNLFGRRASAPGVSPLTPTIDVVPVPASTSRTEEFNTEAPDAPDQDEARPGPGDQASINRARAIGQRHGSGGRKTRLGKAAGAAGRDERNSGPGHSASFNIPMTVGNPSSGKAQFLTLRRGSVPDMPGEGGAQPDGDLAQSSEGDEPRSTFRRWSTGATDTNKAPRRVFPEGERDLPVSSIAASMSFFSRSSGSSVASMAEDVDASVGGNAAEALRHGAGDGLVAPTLLGRGVGKYPTSGSTADSYAFGGEAK